MRVACCVLRDTSDMSGSERGAVKRDKYIIKQRRVRPRLSGQSASGVATARVRASLRGFDLRDG